MAPRGRKSPSEDLSPFMARNPLRFPILAMLIAAFSLTAWAADKDKEVAIETVPAGAQVEVNGSPACTSPCSLKLPSENLGLKFFAFSKHATEPVSIRLVKQGCAPKSVVLSAGPIQWKDNLGIPVYKYYQIPSPKFTFTLDAPDPPSAPDASSSPASPPAGSACGETDSSVKERLRMAVQGALVSILTPDGRGTGFFITHDGILLTSTAVAGPYKVLTARFADGRSVEFPVLYLDEKYGLVLAKVPGSGYPVVELGRNAPDPGADLYCISSRDPASGTATDSVARLMVQKNYLNRFEAWIQTDKPLDRQYSGGPLLDRNGKVVGISTDKNPVASDGLYLSPESTAVEKFVRSHLGAGWRAPNP
jgi:hypothetical protein